MSTSCLLPLEFIPCTHREHEGSHLVCYPPDHPVSEESIWFEIGLYSRSPELWVLRAYESTRMTISEPKKMDVLIEKANLLYRDFFLAG